MVATHNTCINKPCNVPIRAHTHQHTLFLILRVQPSSLIISQILFTCECFLPLLYYISAGTTPLYFAAQEGRLTAVQYLHEKGKCDLFTPSSDGRRPIHAACQCGHTHIVKVQYEMHSQCVLSWRCIAAKPRRYRTLCVHIHCSKCIVI